MITSVYLQLPKKSIGKFKGKLIKSLAFAFPSLLPVSVISAQPVQRPNVLFIMVDDLRPELGCYGVETVKTPNIDCLAEKSTLFQNAYCNIPVSGASRASLLTGMYPKFPERFKDYTVRASVDVPNAVPLSRVFTDNGYHTISNGKFFHHIDDFAETWSEPPFRTHPEGYDVYSNEYNRWEQWLNESSGNFINPRTKRGPYFEMAEVPDSAYDDGKLALKTIADLKRLKTLDMPFFLGVGFWKPHLPFNAPKKYWDLYDRDSIPLPTNRFRPKNLPVEVQNSGEIYAYARVREPEDTDYLRELRHGYYACVSYVDAQIGMVLDALKELDLDKNTIIVLLGDHGWNLGEHNFIGKHNLMKTSMQSPLLIYVPWLEGGKTLSMVEFVDIYPTLCELCDLPVPNNQLDGQSFISILENPKSKTKDHVFVQWQGGYSIVSERYNYAEWPEVEDKPVMIFDHKKDPQENKNRSKECRYKFLIRKLSRKVDNAIHQSSYKSYK
ncbi:sulfatase [Petrimonas sp.]|uniref:sulfatase n=1 Tax=Petrimonas sp. TaxID=2023866 RepID=UPI003F50EDFC